MAVPRWDDNIHDWIDDDTGVVGTPTGTPTPDDPTGSPGTGYYGAPTGGDAPTTPAPNTGDPFGIQRIADIAKTAGGSQPTSSIGPFTGQFTAPNARPLPNFPTYTPPPAFAFNAPTPEDAKNDPGYQFRVQQGNQGLQAWAAARGTLNDTGTATALSDLNQNEATQEYANVWNRDWQQQTGQYMTNYQTQYVDPYQFGVQGYSAQAPNILHENDMDYQHAWDAFLNDEDMWKYNTTNAINMAGA